MATNKRLIKSNDEAAGGASFNTVTYTADGAVTPITGVGFQPDFVWIKGRTLGSNHQLTDVVRTAPNCLGTNGTGAETTRGVQSFDSDGFTLQVFPNENGDSNTSGEDYVAWCWKAGGAAVTNTDGTATNVQVSANQSAGFSIVTMDADSGVRTVGHGLSSAPELIIWKSRTSSTNYWQVLAQAANGGNGHLGRLALQRTDAFLTVSSVWNNTQPTPTVFTLGTSCPDKAVAYCFHSVPGFSKFGSYVGSDGNVVTTGFEPAFVLIKSTTNAAGGWNIFDNKRGLDRRLYPHLSNAEGIDSPAILNFTPTGFSFNTRDSWTNGSHTYIYMAFANQF